jgi:hypothetical protein
LCWFRAFWPLRASFVVRRQKPVLMRVFMDAASQHVTTGLGALARTLDKLRSFGYALYLETKATGWTQPRGLTFCGKGYAPSMPAVTMGFAIHRDDTGERSLIFSILVAWDTTHWSIQSFVEDEDGTRDEITNGLWESAECSGSTLDEFVASLEQSVHALMSSTQDQRVAAMLATVARRP